MRLAGRFSGGLGFDDRFDNGRSVVGGLDNGLWLDHRLLCAGDVAAESDEQDRAASESRQPLCQGIRHVVAAYGLAA